MLMMKERNEIRKQEAPIPPDRKRGFQIMQRSNKRDPGQTPENKPYNLILSH